MSLREVLKEMRERYQARQEQIHRSIADLKIELDVLEAVDQDLFKLQQAIDGELE